MHIHTFDNKNKIFNLSQFAIGQQAINYPDRLALKVISQTATKSLPTSWTFSELDQSIRSIAAGLIKAGVCRGDFFLIRLESDTPFALTFFACIAAGIIPVPLSPQLTAKEVDFYLHDTGAKFIAWSGEQSGMLPLPSTLPETVKIIKQETILEFIKSEPAMEYAESRAEDPAFLIYSSGTTSQPKGVLHAQRTVLGRLPMQAGWHQMTKDDIVLHAGEFNWTYTLGVGLMDPWIWGASALVYSGEKQPDLWSRLIQANQATIFAAVPGVYRKILKYSPPTKSDMSSLRHCLSAGETLQEHLRQEWQEQTGVCIYEAMGQSEISTYVSTAKGVTVPQTAKGRIQENRTVVILPDTLFELAKTPDEIKNIKPLGVNQNGLIAVHKSDPGLMLGYWQREDEMKKSFIGDWFLTGDSGSIDEQHNLTHYGRTDDVMNASGYRVSPEEIETCLQEHPFVSEAAVTELQVSEDLSLIAAYIVLDHRECPTDEKKGGDNHPDKIITELKTYLTQNLATYKHPKSFHFLNDLPRNRAGKVLRSELNSWPNG